MPNPKVHNNAAIPWSQLRLQPFPDVALKVLQLYKDENIQLSQISSLISSDPAFASEVLVVVNSYLYSAREAITSILHAVVALGARRVEGLCLTVGVRTYLGRKLHDPVMRRLWQHSMATAIIAEQLAQIGFIDPDTAYTAGILHDVGRIGLASVRPVQYSALLATHAGPSESILQREQELFGVDHCEVGLELVREWKLPEDFGCTTEAHHGAHDPAAGWTLEELLKMSCKLADAAGFPAFVGCKTEPYEDLLLKLPEREKAQFYETSEALHEEVASCIKALEAS